MMTFEEYLLSVCMTELEEDLCQPECIQAVGHMANQWVRAHADLIDGNNELAEELMHSNKKMTAEFMASEARRTNNRLYQFALENHCAN